MNQRRLMMERAVRRLNLALRTLPKRDRKNITKVRLIWRRKAKTSIVARISPGNGNADIYMDQFSKMNLRTMKANLLHEAGHVDCYKNHPPYLKLLNLLAAAEDRVRRRRMVTRYTKRMVRWAGNKPTRNRLEIAAREAYAEIYAMPPSERAKYCDRKMMLAYHAIPEL